MKRTQTILLALFALFATTGCSKHTAYARKQLYSTSGIQESPAAEMRASNADGLEFEAKGYAEDSYDSTDSDASANEQSALPAERKLIRTGDMTLEVTSLAETKTAVEAWVKQYGGYISNSSEDSSSLSINAQIPSSHFDEAMKTSSRIGKIVSKSVNSRDVTEEFYDLDTRLSTRRILLERLQTYLKQAKDVKDMIEIESKINDVTTEMERMQGRLNRLTEQIDYSEIDIYAKLPVNRTEEGFILPDTKSQFREFCKNILNFFSNFLFVVLYIIIYGVPSVLMIFLLYWLCFGKIGLLRKLFAKIRAPHKEKIPVEKK